MDELRLGGTGFGCLFRGPLENVFWLQEEDLLILTCRSGGKGAGTVTLLREADG